jgi:hypothetical protein
VRIAASSGLSQDRYLATGKRDLTQQRAQQSGLAGAVWTDDANELASLQLEIRAGPDRAATIGD